MDLNALSMDIHREHDACGIFSQIEKSGQPSHNTVQNGLDALKAMRHRAGYVAGEGDGCGLLLDIPRALWKFWFEAAGIDTSLVESPGFFVAHIFLDSDQAAHLQSLVDAEFSSRDVKVLMHKLDGANRAALGPMAQAVCPVFYQVAGLLDGANDELLAALFTAIDDIHGVHVASLSHESTVYKVIGNDETLYRFYSDLQNPLFKSTFVLAHTRYSTNTATSFPRVQPFSSLGHNGEINTILRFYTEASMIGVPVRPDFSDSQMVDRALLSFVSERHWTLFETAELLFPPIVHEIKQMSDELSDLYMYYRSIWGPFAGACRRHDAARKGGSLQRRRTGSPPHVAGGNRYSLLL
ncbi:hypothetical protein [Alicyclobacillus fastidiosus]|uniref:hypothetical protein n=1 Tax=Alicyclobacillus fastidiosus TaxID=392011 RepID=UPI0023E9AFF6|nr:hypothetical protein GCM10025859_23150 [Alicyclobacillus fastidiosus]